MSETTNGSAPKSKSQKGHCKRFWWVYLLVLIIIIVIVIPVIILVAVPKIAQKKVDEAQLNIQGVTITKSETGSLNMAINSTITTDGSTHAVIAGFTGTMWLLDVDPPIAFATVDFPDTPSDALVLVNISQPMQIDHLAELTTFNQYLLEKESVNVRVEGDTTVRVSGIARDYPITFSKDVTFTGFNSFAGISVTNPHVSLAPSDNFNSTTTIPNPTIWTVEVGNVSFSTFFNDTSIGKTNITNMVLYPGDNNFTAKGDIAQAVVIKALQQRPYCENGGVLPIQLAGNTVVNNDQPVPWLANALSAFNVTLDIAIGAAAKKDVGLDLPCLPTVTSNSTSSTNSTR